MRIATWNVNSIRTRVDRVVDFLVREDIDVLAMQEIKCRPDQFPAAHFAAAGYELAVHGFNQWNGVAFASRFEITEVSRDFADMPGFGLPVKGQEAVQLPGVNGLPLEARALGVTVQDLRLWSLYVPNGRALDHPHYAYKLDWLRAVQAGVAGHLAQRPEQPLAIMGDFNVAPLPQDVGDPMFVVGQTTHVSPAERAAFAALERVLPDVVRPFAPTGYTFWDYTQQKFARDLGIRIDFILGSESFNAAVTDARIAREEREGERPSDHVPVVCEIDPDLLNAEAGFDDAPMIFDY
ncbi:MAG: exodeoxyribonuclease III [Microbacteriaceae bacterium]|nr:exodeoxyribonuclease III [Microbacteriaceae bacterium]